MKRLIAFSALGWFLFPCLAIDTPPPVLKSIVVSNGVKTVTFTPAPAIETYTVKSSGNVGVPFTNDGSAVLSGTTFRTTNTQPFKFYSLAATPMSSNDLLTVNLLNRIAYGPTPDELARVKAMGPQAYINEQLAPENLTETIDTYSSQTTNASPTPPPLAWQFLSFSGTFSQSNLYAYLTAAGDAYIDDISVVPTVTAITTNIVPGVSTNYTTNVFQGDVVVNGGFERTNLAPWVATANMAASALTTAYAHSGTQSLHMVAAAAGAGRADSIYQDWSNSISAIFPQGLPLNTPCSLSFWYLPATNSRAIHLRLSGSGVVGSGNNAAPVPTWYYVTASGIATATPTFYLYLSGAGEAYIDDLKLVAGSVAEVGQNLLRNGDFELPLAPTNFVPTANFTNSFISSNYSHSGAGSLKIIATAGGSGSGNALVQTNVPVANNQTYTVSFWYTTPTRGRAITARLSGSSTVGLLSATAPDGSSGSIRRRLDHIHNVSFEDGAETSATIGGAQIQDLRAWHVLNAVGGKRQLIEVLLQFLENHFVTQYSKSVDYLNRFYQEGNVLDVLATDWEFRENTKWRASLLNPNGTFYDLLKIHVESPAEIVYLDSVDSRGDGNNVANENYAREIQELFCLGVNNGYEQQDIIAMSRSWTGWSVEIVDPENLNNPFAAQTKRNGFYTGYGSTSVSNLVGVWAFNFKPNNHGTNRAPIWSQWDPASPATNPQPIKIAGVPQSKKIPARFGAPWANQPYALTIPAGRVTGNTNGILDGYDVTAAIANLPFTMEFISVKLCRLFVHENFVHGTYSYTDPNRSAEAELVRQCMVAWDTPVAGRKGNIRSILNVIFNSDLFRSHGGSLQKVKTPLEYSVSAIRALRATNGTGGTFASTDGYSIVGRNGNDGNAPLSRMGNMQLFNRDAPDGYPEAGAPWISSGTLAERVRYVQTALMATTDANKNDGISGGNNNLTDPVGLLKAKLLSGNWNNAGAVADYFLGLLYPSEGKANLDAYRTLAISFLDTNDNGVGTSLFASLNNTTAAYDTRVRAMVAMLMTLPRFQEQ